MKLRKFKKKQEHSPMSPSSSKRWLKCPASFAMTRDLPPLPAGEEAQWGSVAHKVAEMALNDETDAREAAKKLGQYPIPEIHIAPNREMLRVVQDYLDVCQGLQFKYPEAASYVERKVSVFRDERIHIFGTVDFLLRRQHTLYVVDLKTGVNPIEADSSQLLMYGWGAMNEFPGAKKIVFVIVQPRDKYGNTLKQAKMTRDDMIEWTEDIMEPGIDECLSATPRFNPDVEACRYCAARTGCSALSGFVKQKAFRDFSTVSLSEKVESYKSFKLIKVWMDSIEEELVSLVMSGKKVKGLKAVRGNSRNEWAVEEDEVATLLREVGLSRKEIFPSRLITAPAALKLVDREYVPRVSELIEKKAGKLTVVPIEDKRPQASISAEDDFDD